MEDYGIIREMDNLGRLVIPKEWRRQHVWGPGTPFSLTLTVGGGVVCRPVGRRCRICGKEVQPGHCLQLAYKQWVCSDCATVVVDAHEQWRKG